MARQVVLMVLTVLLPLMTRAAELKGTVTCEGKPLSGVVVSDGLNCLKTDAEGAFILPGHDRAHFVTVSVPAGYRPAARHYIPVTEGAASYDFKLLPWERSAQDNVKLIQFTDTEQASGSLVWATQARDYANYVGAAALVHSGDICYRNGLRYHAENVNPEKLGMPIYYTNGNHDLLKDDPEDFGEKTFESLFGPPWYSWNAGKLHVVMLPVPYGDRKTGYKTEAVARWLKNDLELKDPGQALVMVTHFVHGTDRDMVYGAGTDCPVDMAKYNLKLIIFGHYHETYHVNYSNGAVAVCSPPPGRGGIDFSAGSFPVYSFEGTELVDVERRYARIDHHLALANKSSVRLLVNAYDSSSPVLDVKVQFFEKGKAVGEPVSFVRKTAWTWEAARRQGDKYEITATFADGQIRKLEMDTLGITIGYLPPVGNKEAWGSAYGNAQRNGFSNRNREGALRFAELWTVNVGSQIFEAAPVIEGGVVFVGTMPGSKLTGGGIQALDLYTGLLKWKYPTGGGIRQSLDVSGGVVVAMDDRNHIYGLDAHDGTLLWEHKADGNVLPQVHGNILDGHRYIANMGGKLMALDVKTGKVLWENPEAGAACSRTSTPQSLVNGVIFWSRHWASTNGYDAATGRKLWSQNDSKIFRYRGMGVIPYNNELALLASYSGGVVLVDPKTGEVRRKIDAIGNKQVGGVPLLHKNMVVYGTANVGLQAYDMESGAKKWEVQTGLNLVSNAPYTDGGHTVFAGPVRIGNQAVFGANDGNLYAVYLETGEVLNKLNLGSPVLAPVAVRDNRLVVVDFGGNVHCFLLY